MSVNSAVEFGKENTRGVVNLEIYEIRVRLRAKKGRGTLARLRKTERVFSDGRRRRVSRIGRSGKRDTNTTLEKRQRNDGFGSPPPPPPQRVRFRRETPPRLAASSRNRTGRTVSGNCVRARMHIIQYRLVGVF